MEASELIERFNDLHADNSHLLRKAFMMLAEVSPKSAYQFLQCVEGMETYNNYVSEEEAMEIVSRFRNADGTDGAKWDSETLFEKVQELGGEIEHEPKYNRWALYVTMNMEHSDHYPVITKWSEGESNRYAELCFDLAVSQLTDKDKPNWIRRYFEI